MKDFGKIKDRYEFSFDSRKLGLILLAAVTASALVFVLGVSVGVQWQTKRAESAGLSQSCGIAAEAKPVPQPPAAPPVEPPPVMPVVTTASAGPAQAAPGPKPADVAGQPAKPVAPARDAKKEKPATAADLTFPKVLSSNNKKTEPLTQPKKPQSGSATFTVQVGAFDERDSAQARVDKLRKKGYDSRLYVSPDKKDKYPYKVRVGRYASREDATAIARKLEALLQTTPYVTAE